MIVRDAITGRFMRDDSPPAPRRGGYVALASASFVSNATVVLLLLLSAVYFRPQAATPEPVAVITKSGSQDVTSKPSAIAPHVREESRVMIYRGGDQPSITTCFPGRGSFC
jgi:hypothetical protein